MSKSATLHRPAARVAEKRPLPAHADDTANLRAAAMHATDHLRTWMHETMHGLPHDSAILALGCEQAFLAPQLAEYSCDVTVLDTCAAQIGQLARRFPHIAFLHHKPAEPLPFPHDTFDALWCCEFLDRVFDPAAALRDLHRVLVPGGRLIVTVPDHGPVRNVLIALFNWDAHFAPSNPRIRHFTRSTLATLARDAGFGEIRTRKGGAVRRLAGGLVPRTLLLTATKGPGLRIIPAARRTRAADDEVTLAETVFARCRAHAA